MLVDLRDDRLAPWLIAPKAYRDTRALIRKALGYPDRRLPLLIGIDGLDGAGKTSLAAWLSWQLEMPAVHLDLYIARDSEPLQYRLVDLAEALNARTLRQQPVIVEGILLLQVLGALNCSIDFLVFVQRVSHQSSLRSLTQSYVNEFHPRSKANKVVKWSSASRDKRIALAHQRRDDTR